MKDRPFRPAFILLPLLLLLAALFLASVALLAPGQGIPAGGSLIEVSQGESAAGLGGRLESEGILRSALAFKVMAKLLGEEGSIRAGSYRVERDMGALAILRLVTEGRLILARLTLPEGLTIKETATRVEKAGIAEASDFIAAATNPKLIAGLGIPAESAEGYLFPDTYILDRHIGGAAAVKAMVENFHARTKAFATLTSDEVHRKVILASIVEREYRVKEEAPLIASVFTNRLRIGMPLQSCATVVYVITERLGRPHPEIVYDRDLMIEDPYNSYRHGGLPPGPIASPGLVALRAAFAPPSSDWLYFRLTDELRGSHSFSSTFDQHVAAGRLLTKKAP